MIFNGVDLEQYFEDDFIVKDVRGRTITQNELETLSIPLANGEILIDSKIPPKILEVDIALNANTKHDLNKKIDELNSIIHTKETVPIVFKDEPDMTYYGMLGTSKEDSEEANVHEATLNIVVLDGVKYGPLREIKLDTQTNKIYYAGTAPVIPEIEIIPSEKTTYAGYTDGEKSVLVGYPIDVETMPYDKEPIIWNKVLVDQTGWIDATTIPNGVATGHILATKDGFIPTDFGTGDGWHGPSMIYTLNEALDDFEISVYTHIFNDVAELGKIEWNLLTQDGEVLSRFEFGDFWNTEKRMVGNAWIGEIGFQEGRTIGAERGMQWNGFKGVTRIRKVGNIFEFYIARVTEEQGHHQISKVIYVDTNNIFNNKIAKIQVTFAAYKNYPPPHVMRIPQIIVRKINPDKENMIPYIAEVGEKITIDKSLNVYRDGEKRLGLNVFSKPIELKKGENTLIALPPTADVTVRFREVFK